MEKRHYILPVCNIYGMPQSSLVFAVSFTPETPNFGTFGGVAHPTRGIFYFLLTFCFLSMYMHVFGLKIMKNS